ncbi:MAG: TRCF domain-containing protein [Ilumatobacteraceae bacterium]
MPTVNTLVVERSRPARPRPDAPAARSRRAQRPACLRLPVPPARHGAVRGGVRAPAHDRRVDRAGQRLQDRDARPRDPRCRQPARRVAVRAHRRDRVRPLHPDGDRGGRRHEGRPAARARRAQARRPDGRLPARRVRRQGGAAPRRIPPPRRGDHGVEVDDIRAEWEDRYGPPPVPAEALLTIGQLRAECHRLGITEVSITSQGARLSPITLPVSAIARLRRLAPRALVKRSSASSSCPSMRVATSPSSSLRCCRR